MLKDYDEGFKVIIAGSSGVGKSSVLLRFVDNIYSKNLLSTIGVDFKFKTFDIKGKKIKMQIWDTAGSENFRSIISAYYRGADAVVLVFALDDRVGFQQLDSYWMSEVNKYREPDCEIMVLANKCDIEREMVSSQEISSFLKKHNISLFKQVSAKTGERVSDSFKMLGEKLLVKGKRRPKQEGRVNLQMRRGNSLDNSSPPPKKGCCS